MERILVIQLKRIGDFVLTVPALGRLRKMRPEAELVLLVPSGLVELAEALPMVNRVIGFESGGVNWRAWASMVAGEWDVCLDFSGTDRAALLTWLSRADLRVGYQKFAGFGMRRLAYHRLCGASVRDLHTVDFHLELIGEALGSWEGTGPPAMFVVGAGIRDGVQRKLKSEGVTGKYVILHPGTARMEKFWLNERWAEVARVVHERLGLQVVLTGTGTGLEEAPLKAIKEMAGVPMVDLCGKLSLAEMTVVIEGAELMVGVDSMAMHLAALAEKPQVALFGPTNPFHWRARHARSMVLQGSSGLPVAEFAPKATPADMNQISTAAVVDAMTSLL
ncbi:glycosyltransferase family 9 protein [Phragmitibacter flavus]|uniref:Glycosyltransferase family 9 protein n=1 Tax=Phragmitibacter flavus TaxID=2576071 RepID=A0A5R8KF24_9BACT|nr:glycosyltransferase family 9 protein [Phragmitibacter flavus]TLD70867.1 glycosyltransferase family 9 protein [Phragmitibacter flavus]